MKVMRCTQSFRASSTGAKVGDLYPDSHPLVEAYPQYFETADVFVKRQFPHLAGAAKPAREEAPVERATAEPGEKRTVAKPRTPRKPGAK